MAVNINEFKNFCEFVSNKVQSGNSVTPSQFNEVAHRAQMQVFEKDRALLVSSGEVSDFLKEFIATKIFNGPFVTGEIILPTNHEHTSEIRSYHIKANKKGIEVPVDQVKNTDWGKILSSALNEPTTRFPKYSELSNMIRIAPGSLSTVTIDYYRTPVKPVWGFDLINNRAVYNASKSTDFEWDDYALNNVAAYYLQLIGVNLKDTELSAFTQQYKQETNSAL